MVLNHIKKAIYPVVLTVITIFAIVGCDAVVDKSGESIEILPGSSRLSDLLSGGGLEGYSKAIQPRDFSFPEDHGPHPGYRNEWWYVTGNLDATSGERFGFELTFFRFSLTPESSSSLMSSWQTNQLYVAHFAITDVDADQFHVAQRYSRGSVGLAGATSDPFRVWLEDWRIESDASNEPWSLRALTDEFGIELDLVTLKPPVLNGNDGLSRKSGEPGNASYYYSIPRLQSNGTVTIADRTYIVSGLSWIDREWSSAALSRQQRGWDWFALQLSDGSDLMFYQLRKNDGSIDTHSAGTWIDTDGIATQLQRDDVSISVTDYWQSERGDRYPAAWDIEIAPLNITLEVRPAMAGQELITNVRYWEGAVDVSGDSGGQEVSRRGYVELTGYAEN